MPARATSRLPTATFAVLPCHAAIVCWLARWTAAVAVPCSRVVDLRVSLWWRPALHSAGAGQALVAFARQAPSSIRETTARRTAQAPIAATAASGWSSSPKGCGDCVVVEYSQASQLAAPTPQREPARAGGSFQFGLRSWREKQ